MSGEAAKLCDDFADDAWPGWENLPAPAKSFTAELVAGLVEPLVHVMLDADEGRADIAQVGQKLANMLSQFIALQFGPAADQRIERIRKLAHNFGVRDWRDEHRLGQGQRIVANYVEGLLPEQPFHDVADYPWCADLASQTDSIRAELAEHRHVADWSSGEGTFGMMGAPDWRAIGLVRDGIWVAPEGHFPKTRAALNAARGFVPDEVSFANLPSSSKIEAHSDNMNYLLVAHLGLVVDEGRCSLKVGDATRQWREGEFLVFDHTFLHSATNDSDRDRFVLLCRFWHPGLSHEERFALGLLLQLIGAMRRRGTELEEERLLVE
mmetsp:Transcript_157865/g.278698  ORF Transcript_157865/g.278698 Transcript_157865/m.278698 type:complete len:323 (+) Transcript_157865:72-1040(+)